MFAHDGQRRAIDSLRTHDVNVVFARDLFGRITFQRAERHVTGVMHHDVEPANLRNNLANRRDGGIFRAHIEFERAKIDSVLFRKFCVVRYDGGVTPGRLA